MSGTVAVRGETGEGGGGRGWLSRLDSDRCGHFRGLFLDSSVYLRKRVCKCKCVCTRASANALYSDCSSQSDFYCQANDHSQESKQPRCLIRFGRWCVFAQGCLVDKVLAEGPGSRVGIRWEHISVEVHRGVVAYVACLKGICMVSFMQVSADQMNDWPVRLIQRKCTN